MALHKEPSRGQKQLRDGWPALKCVNVSSPFLRPVTLPLFVRKVRVWKEIRKRLQGVSGKVNVGACERVERIIK